MSAEVSDQVVKMMLMGVEVSVRIAGAATKHLVAFLLALKNGDRKISGRTNLAKIVTQSKNVRIFTVKNENLDEFKRLAKKYGILYTVIRDKSMGDGIRDIMVKGEDASKLQRVFDIMGYGDVDRDEPIVMEEDKKKQASRQERESQRSRQERTGMDNRQVVGKSGKIIPAGKYDYQPDPVNGLDGKDPKELPPADKTELAEKMRGKSISARKHLAEGYIQSRDGIEKSKTKTIQKEK